MRLLIHLQTTTTTTSHSSFLTAKTWCVSYFLSYYPYSSFIRQLRRAMNIKVTNSMLNRINHNAALPRPLRIRGTSDSPHDGRAGLSTMA